VTHWVSRVFFGSAQLIERLDQLGERLAHVALVGEIGISGARADAELARALRYGELPAAQEGRAGNAAGVKRAAPNAQPQSMAEQPFARLTRATVPHGCNPSGTVGFDFQWLGAEAKTMDIMMRRIAIGLTALTIATAGLTVSAPAFPGGRSIGVGPGFQSFLPRKAPLLRIRATDMGPMGPIPTEDKPLYDRARIKQLRDAGKLPDTFVRGRCTYNLGGDPGTAWYYRSCK
jgi:hypothetical protein